MPSTVQIDRDTSARRLTLRVSIPWRPESYRSAAAIAVCAIALLPSLIWTLRDRRVWPWDQAWYGEVSTDLWYLLTHSLRGWYEMMAGGLNEKAPGIVWIGQFFVPLRALFPSIEAALLFSILLTQLALLIVIYRTGASIAPDSRTAGFTAAASAACAQIFVGFSHQYFVEPMQALSVAWIVFLMLRSREWPPARTLIHLAAATLLGLLAKASTPLYFALPWIAVAIGIVRNKTAWNFRREWTRGSSRALFAAFLNAGAFGAIWYRRNLATMMHHALISASGEVGLHYGFRAPAAEKFVLWARYLERAFLDPYLTWIAAILAVAGIIPLLRRRRELTWMLLCIAQLTLILVVFSVNDSMETRFLYPAAPYVAAVIAILFAHARYRALHALLFVACAAQWMVVNRASFQSSPVLANQFPWLSPIITDPVRFDDFTEAVRRTSIAPGYNIVAVQEPWINDNSAAFFAAKNRLDTGVRSYYTSLGYAQKDAAAALKRIDEFNARFVLDLDEPYLSPPNFLNEITLPVLRTMKNSDHYRRVPMQSRTGIVIFERLSAKP